MWTIGQKETKPKKYAFSNENAQVGENGSACTFTRSGRFLCHSLQNNVKWPVPRKMWLQAEEVYFHYELNSWMTQPHSTTWTTLNNREIVYTGITWIQIFSGVFVGVAYVVLAVANAQTDFFLPLKALAAQTFLNASPYLSHIPVEINWRIREKININY